MSEYIAKKGRPRNYSDDVVAEDRYWTSISLVKSEQLLQTMSFQLLRHLCLKPSFSCSLNASEIISFGKTGTIFEM